MTHLKLTYFDFPGGRGEASRIALHMAGVDWEDDRLQGGWPDKKPTTPFGGLPLLEVEGKGVLSQSNAILSYIGNAFGLLPSDPWEAARHVALMNAVEELRAYASNTSRDDDDEKRKAREEFASGYLQSWAKGASGEIRGPFVAGDDISVADLKLYVSLRSYQTGVYDHIPTDVFDGFPKLTTLISSVAAHPKVAAWLAKQV